MSEVKGLIGITGRAGSGKDLVKSIIKDKIYPNYSTVRFADKLKQAAEVMFGWTQEQIEDRDFKEAIDPVWGFSPRKAMQLLGTEYGRGLREDLWIHSVRVLLQSPSTEGLIVSDVRFDNEAEFIRENGGTLLHIQRPNGDETALSTHASEIPVTILPSDKVIINDGTISELTQRVALALNKEIDPTHLNF